MSEKESSSPASGWQPEAIAKRLNTEALPENDGSYRKPRRLFFAQAKSRMAHGVPTATSH
jgi:hypothetical protein